MITRTAVDGHHGEKGSMHGAPGRAKSRKRTKRVESRDRTSRRGSKPKVRSVAGRKVRNRGSSAKFFSVAGRLPR